MKFIILLSILSVNVILSYVICENKIACPDGYQCCKKKTGYYGCCPSKDTCCYDGEYCCNKANSKNLQFLDLLKSDNTLDLNYIDEISLKHSNDCSSKFENIVLIIRSTIKNVLRKDVLRDPSGLYSLITYSLESISNEIKSTFSKCVHWWNAEYSSLLDKYFNEDLYAIISVGFEDKMEKLILIIQAVKNDLFNRFGQNYLEDILTILS
jgi:hypothetical protein